MKKTVFITFCALFVLAACKQKAKPEEKTAIKDTVATKPVVEQQDTTTNNDTTQQYAVITTPMGKIVVKLYNETPQHRDNFIKLVKEGYYNNLLFHRVIPGFMVQGGDPDSKTAKAGQALGAGDLGYTIPAEINNKLIHKKGALAAARTENPQKRSSSCQFYLVQGQKYDDYSLQNMAANRGYQYTPEQVKAYTEIGGTPSLDGNYTVFGEVVSGLNIIDVIANQQRDPNDRPFSDIKFSIKMGQK